mmetsp:Transcript_6549/g.11320  ORF Transcript_6549/g.11320 Transcript_6549/m.11320 type:complete len:296 (+) Transcript_6549:1003-1890(+)
MRLAIPRPTLLRHLLVAPLLRAGTVPHGPRGGEADDGADGGVELLGGRGGCNLFGLHVHHGHQRSVRPSALHSGSQAGARGYSGGGATPPLEPLPQSIGLGDVGVHGEHRAPQGGQRHTVEVGGADSLNCEHHGAPRHHGRQVNGLLGGKLVPNRQVHRLAVGVQEGEVPPEQLPPVALPLDGPELARRLHHAHDVEEGLAPNLGAQVLEGNKGVRHHRRRHLLARRDRLNRRVRAEVKLVRVGERGVLLVGRLEAALGDVVRLAHLHLAAVLRHRLVPQGAPDLRTLLVHELDV